MVIGRTGSSLTSPVAMRVPLLSMLKEVVVGCFICGKKISREWLPLATSNGWGARPATLTLTVVESPLFSSVSSADCTLRPSRVERKGRPVADFSVMEDWAASVWMATQDKRRKVVFFILAIYFTKALIMCM